MVKVIKIHVLIRGLFDWIIQKYVQIRSCFIIEAEERLPEPFSQTFIEMAQYQKQRSEALLAVDHL